MHRPGYSTADSESLQTDVMRFMAIIAFCLIAILALVRNVEPVTPTQANTAPSPASAVTPTPAKVEVPRTEATAIPALADPEPLRAMTPIRPLPVDKPQPGTQREPQKVAAVQPAPPEKIPPPQVEPAQEITAAPPEPAPESADEEQGLSLRFASDRDFMRLVAKGDIQVYAFKAEDVLALDQTFRFLDSPAPDRVYELLPETIPALMASALHSERTETAGYVWGIHMPARLEQRIRAYIDQGATGQLIINRYGEVQHATGA